MNIRAKEITTRCGCCGCANTVVVSYDDDDTPAYDLNQRVEQRKQLNRVVKEAQAASSELKKAVGQAMAKREELKALIVKGERELAGLVSPE